MDTQQTFNTYLNFLQKVIPLKSISTDKRFEPEIRKTVGVYEKIFKEEGFEVEIFEGYQNPIILASLQVSPQLETVLLYGHYDVQPAQREEGWEKDPFELNITEDKLIARGIIDNKGQLGVHLATIFELYKQGKLGFNIKVLLEGDEESGSEGLETFLKEHKDKLKADFILISDGELTLGYPTIELGFRGGFNCELEIKTGETELHSGLYGGGVPSASFELLRVLSNLFVEEGKTVLRTLQENLPEIPQELVAKNKERVNLAEVQKTAKTKAVFETELDFYSQVGLLPSVIITGLKTGYTGEGFRNSIPNKALAKINFRLAPTQNPDPVVKELQEFFERTVPDWVDYKLKIQHPYKGVMLDIDNPYVKRASSILQEVFGTEPFYKFCGGGLPVVTHFHEILNIPQVLVPLANKDCNMHAPQENFKKETLQKALEFSARFFVQQ